MTSLGYFIKPTRRSFSSTSFGMAGVKLIDCVKVTYGIGILGLLSGTTFGDQALPNYCGREDNQVAKLQSVCKWKQDDCA
jgi:hypothetical protein